MIDAAGFITQPPEDLPTASQSTLLLQKRKEMQEVQQQLDRKKEEFRARMQRCQEKEVDLAARQEDIKEQVRKFDKFLKDNDAKRVRADRKVQEEKKACVQKENEKAELEKILADQTEKRQLLMNEVMSKGKFQGFLDAVCEHSSEYFESIENITMRYDTLAAAHGDLSERVETSSAEHETYNTDFLSFIKNSQNDLLVYNSEIAKKQQDLDNLRLKSTAMDGKLAKGDVEAKAGTRLLGEVKMAIHNIHGRCKEGRRVKKEEGEDLGTFLDAIKQRVVDLQSIVTGHDRPVGFAEMAAVVAAFGSREKTAPAADQSYSLPDRVKGDASAKPAASGVSGESPGASMVAPPSKKGNSQMSGPISRTSAAQA